MADIIPKEIDREGVRLLTRRGGQLVEVLAREEYDQIHLAGAICIPLNMFSRKTADRLQWDKPVIVYSRDSLCDRSARAAWRLASLGFTQVYRYTLGKADWLANGLPIEGAQARVATVGDLSSMEVPTCKRNERIADIKERVQKDGWSTCVVVNDQEIVLGLLTPVDFEKATPTWSAEETMERDPQTFRLDASIEAAQGYMQQNHVEQVLVTTPDGKLFGLLQLKDIDSAGKAD